MKIVSVSDGLGNQMFQYAFGLAVSRRSGEQVLYDLNWFEEARKPGFQHTVRDYGLDLFSAQVEIASAEQIKSCINKRRVPRIFRKWIKPSNIVREKTFDISYKAQMLDVKGDAYYVGYWQTEKYFSEFRSDVLRAFSLKAALDESNAAMLARIHGCNSCSVHIRRGDYVKNQEKFGLCSLDYYREAMAHIASHSEAPHFFVFSDDSNWVRENLKSDFPMTVVDINANRKEHFDLHLMQHCKHNIIANSTFSWWAAWLNDYERKMVIAPSRWFALETSNWSDIIARNWITI